MCNQRRQMAARKTSCRRSILNDNMCIRMVSFLRRRQRDQFERVLSPLFIDANHNNAISYRMVYDILFYTYLDSSWTDCFAECLC
jgi:hypothetical protein